jgi:hypothetical protein
MADMEDLEVKSKASAGHDEIAVSSSNLAPKLDSHGFPLRPQPSDDPRGMETYQLQLCNNALY